MSHKSDTDNRANQLNPNNDAFYSSRGSDDDDDYTHETTPLQRHSRDVFSELGSATVSREFVLVYIGFSGRARLIDLQLVQLRSFNRTDVSDKLASYAAKLQAGKLKDVERELGDRIAYSTLYKGADHSIWWRTLDRPANALAATAAQIRIEQFLLNRADQDALPALIVTTKVTDSIEGPDDIRGSATMLDVMVAG